MSRTPIFTILSLLNLLACHKNIKVNCSLASLKNLSLFPIWCGSIVYSNQCLTWSLGRWGTPMSDEVSTLIVLHWEFHLSLRTFGLNFTVICFLILKASSFIYFSVLIAYIDLCLLLQGQDNSLGSLSDVDDLETTFMKVCFHDDDAILVLMNL